MSMEEIVDTTTSGVRRIMGSRNTKKNPGGLSFFQWIGGFGDLSSMGSFFLGICRVFQILYFSTKENLIFIEIGWGKKIKKSILGMDSN